jgi:hypothetical protein
MKCGGKPGGGNDARRKSLRDSLRAWKSLRDSHIPTARLLLYILKTYFRKEPSSPPAPFPFRLILGLEKTGNRKALRIILVTPTLPESQWLLLDTRHLCK